MLLLHYLFVKPSRAFIVVIVHNLPEKVTIGSLCAGSPRSPHCGQNALKAVCLAAPTLSFKLQLGKLVLGAHVCWLGALAVCSDEDLASDNSVCSAAACSGANSAMAWHDSLSPSLAQQQDKSGADSAELGVQINNVVD